MSTYLPMATSRLVSAHKTMHYFFIAIAFVLSLCVWQPTASAQCPPGCTGVSVINCSAFNTRVAFTLCCNGNETISRYIPARANTCNDTAPISFSPCVIMGVESFVPALPPWVNYTWDPTTCTLLIY